MNLKFDREIMKWFDAFFEDSIESLLVDSFLCSQKIFDSYSHRGRLFTLEKKNSKYWKIEFFVPENKVLSIEKNVSPFFKEYIIEEISMYRDDEIYSFLNDSLKDIYRRIVKYTYIPEKNAYTMAYTDEFMEICRGLKVGDLKLISEDLVMKIWSEDKISIENRDDSFKLTLNYETKKEEDLMDALLDLRKSVILNVLT